MKGNGHVIKRLIYVTNPWIHCRPDFFFPLGLLWNLKEGIDTESMPHATAVRGTRQLVLLQTKA
jgi:hypothetical protein